MKPMALSVLLVLAAAWSVVALGRDGVSTNALPSAMFTVQVINDEGDKVPNMPVRIWLDEATILMGHTDSNGLYVAHGRCSTIDPPIRIEKGGYYTTVVRCRFTNIVEGVERQWIPWNPTVTAVTRQIIHPIPMYGKCVETMIPKTNEVFGFDLEIGDWVCPIGKGVISDLVFSVKGEWNTYRDNDSTLSLAFSHFNDGLVTVGHDVFNRQPNGSVFILPRYAPEKGYANVKAWRSSRKSVAGFVRDEIIDEVNVEGRDYLLRVRSQTNEMGVVTNGHYGKLHGNIEFVGVAKNSQGSWLKFTYYLNPTPNDRNLEFDPKQNLFKNLKPTERVTAP